MPSPNLRHYSSLVGAIDRQLLCHLPATKMKIGKAPVLLKKAVMMCKNKTGELGARLLVLTSLRRRIATVGVISQKIQTLMVAADQVKARGHSCHKVEKMSAIHGGEIVDISHQLALFDKEENGDWTLHPIFSDNDNYCYTEVYEEDVHEPSVIDEIRSTREVEGLEFNMDDEIDQAAEMFIRRFREQMNKSF